MKVYELIESIYDLYDKPEELTGYKDRYETIPEFAWEKCGRNKEELRKREHLWAQEAKYAYWYVQQVLKGPFPAGEKAIASVPMYAYLYASSQRTISSWREGNC